MNKPIGIFDSGIGGLTVCKEVMQLLPKESVVYIGDSKNTPYGNKSEEYIYQFAQKMIRFLLEKQAKLIVVACNTVTVRCIDTLREDFADVPIIGTVPVIKKAVEVTKNKRIGILSTTQTAQSEYQKKLINTFADGCFVLNQGTDELVPLIEQAETGGERVDTVLKRILEPFKKEDIDTLVLGCTHFPFVRESIEKELGKGVTILDSGAAIARQVKHVLEHNAIEYSEGEGTHQFFTTGDVHVFSQIVKKYIGSSDLTIQKASL